MSDSITIALGELYCPKCLRQSVELNTEGQASYWHCTTYCGRIEWPFGTDESGHFTWLWDDEHPAPNPGCPWCGTRNIVPTSDGFVCLRESCKKRWRGKWTQQLSFDDAPNGDWRTARWLIKVPVATVPWSTDGLSGKGPIRTEVIPDDGDCRQGCCCPFCY